MQENAEWLKEIIKTANNDFQFACCIKLIETFHKEYRHTGKTRDLYDALYASERSIINVPKNNQN